MPEEFINVLFTGQIDGQEITAAPVLLPKPRPVPPRRSPPMPLRRPPPRWGRSPPRLVFVCVCGGGYFYVVFRIWIEFVCGMNDELERLRKEAVMA